MELCIVFGVKNTQPLENLYNYVFFYYLQSPTWTGNFRYVPYLESCCFKIHENIFNLWYDPQIYSFASLFFFVFLWFLSIVWRGGQKYISRQAQRHRLRTSIFHGVLKCFSRCHFIYCTSHIPKVKWVYTKMMSLSWTNLLCRSYIQ